jgi:hypothetical protein
LQDAIELLANLVIPKPQHRQASFGEKTISRSVAPSRFLVIVAASIEFNNEPRFRAVKVDDVRIDRVLSPEFVAAEISIAQTPPQNSFGVSGLAPEVTRAIHGLPE